MEQKRSARDAIIGDDGGESVGVAVLDHDELPWKITARVDKFDLDAIDLAREFFGIVGTDEFGDLLEPDGDQLLAVAQPYESIEIDGNLLTTAGLARITSLITGGGGQAWDTTHTRIGVGNDATAAAVGNTDLTAAAGSGNRQFQTADNSTPTTSNGVITIRATFGTSVANFAWQEWVIDAGTANGTTVVATMMNHKVTSLGTKTSAASWVFTITITLA